MVLALIAVLLAVDEKQDGEHQLAEAVKVLNDGCGPITATYDWASEAATPGKPAYQGPLFCKSAVEGLGHICGIDEAARTAITANVKAVKCVFQDGTARRSGRWGPQLALDGSTVVVTFDWNSGNVDSDTTDWVLKKMLLPGPNGPESVEAKQERPRGVSDLADAASDLTDKCGTKIAVDYDLSSERPSPAKPAYQGYLYCKSIVDGLSQACELDKAKGKVEKKVKSLHCHYLTAASAKQKSGPFLQLKKTLLDAAYDWDSANLADETRLWVGKKL